MGCTVNLKCKVAQVMCQLLQLLWLCRALSLMASSVSESTLDILLLFLSQSVIFFPPSSWTVARSVLLTLISLPALSWGLSLSGHCHSAFYSSSAALPLVFSLLVWASFFGFSWEVPPLHVLHSLVSTLPTHSNPFQGEEQHLLG